MTRLIVLLVTLFLWAAPCRAQVEVVAKYRGLYPTPLSTEQKIALLKAVALEVHGGLLVKPDGHNCLGYACDVICFSPTALFDVLEAEGEAAIPRWTATENPRGYKCELVAPPPAPLPPPVVEPPPGPLVIDYDRIAAIVKADGDQTRAQLTAHDEQPSWLRRALGNRVVQMVGVALATWATERQMGQ